MPANNPTFEGLYIRSVVRKSRKIQQVLENFEGRCFNTPHLGSRIQASMSAGYRYIIAEVINASHENSRHKIRARPLPGQWASPACRIECPLHIRRADNVGQLYKFWAKFKNTDTAIQLYTSYYWSPEPVNPEEAEAFIAAQKCS
jgi:hypothetical protein